MVGGVQEQVLARCEVVGTEGEVVAVGGQHVEVEEHLLAWDRLVVARVGGRLNVGAAQDRVLLPLFGAAVEPAAVLSERHRQIGLLDASLHLPEQGVLQLVGVGERLSHEGVLRRQQLEHLRVVTVVAAQPVPVIRPLVAVVDVRVGAAWGGRRRRRHGGRAYGLSRRPRYGRCHV